MWGKTVLVNLESSVTGITISSTQSVILTTAWQRVSVPFTSTVTTPGSFYQAAIEGLGTLNVQLTRASVEVGTLVPTLYCKTAGTPYGALSRYAAGVHIALPLIPAAPIATVDTADITAPVITVTLPAVQDNVWGYEIRSADNKKVLVHQDIIDGHSTDLVAGQYKFTDNGNSARNPHYLVYTYNLLGEFSVAWDTSLSATVIPTPQISILTVDDDTKKLTWTGINSSSYLVEIDATSASMSNIIRSINTPDNFYVLDDSDFFPLRYIRVTAIDDIGAGLSGQVSHQFEAPAIVEFGANECQDVPAPRNGKTDPAIPSGSLFSQFSAEIIAESWKNYASNNGRYG
jgi:hypothetical protein